MSSIFRVTELSAVCIKRPGALNRKVSDTLNLPKKAFRFYPPFIAFFTFCGTSRPMQQPEDKHLLCSSSRVCIENTYKMWKVYNSNQERYKSITFFHVCSHTQRIYEKKGDVVCVYVSVTRLRISLFTPQHGYHTL